jgi:general secretion pathway protein D
VEVQTEKRQYKYQRIFSPLYVSLYLVFVSLFVLAPTRNAKVVYPSGQEVGGIPVGGSQGPPNKEKSNPQFVEIDFYNVNILLFVKFVSEATGKNFVVDPEVKGKVTIVSPEKMPVDEVYKVFQSVLEVHGYTTVEAGSVVKIVPSATARGKGVKTGFIEKSGTAEDKFVTQVFHLNYLSPDDAKSMLTPLVSQDSVIVSHPGSGTLVITDFLSNIERLRRIIEPMDLPGFREEISVGGE